MHVVDVTMFYAPQSGGVRRYIEAKRAWLLTQPDCAHTLVAPARKLTAESRMRALRSLPLPLSNGYRLPLGKTAAVRQLVQAVSLCPSIIEAGDPYQLAWAALEAGAVTHTPTVAFCHSDLPQAIGRRYGAHAEALASAYFRRLYTQFDLVLAPSACMTARLLAMGVRQARRQPLGVDVALFSPRARSGTLRRALELPEQTRLLVFAGRFAPEKNLPVLFDALRRLGHPYVLLLIGAGRLRGPLPDNVRVLEYASERARLVALLADCDAFVHAGDQETFGLAALEAMACGLPVVGARAGGIAELVSSEAGAGILVPPGSAVALAEGIDALFRGDWRLAGVLARALALRYAWSWVLPQLHAHYRRLCAPPLLSAA